MFCFFSFFSFLFSGCDDHHDCDDHHGSHKAAPAPAPTPVTSTPAITSLGA